MVNISSHGYEWYEQPNDAAPCVRRTSTSMEVNDASLYAEFTVTVSDTLRETHVWQK